MSKSVIVSSLYAALAASASAAQVQTPPATLAGTVRDSSGVPVVLAQLTLLSIRGVSDSAGRFVLAGLPPGAATLHVRRMGFEPLDVTLELGAGRTDSVRLVLVTLPRELAGVVTESDTRGLRLADFYRHRQNGQGYYYDRKEIEERKVQRISDLLRRLPGVRLVPDRTGRYQLRMSRTGGGRDCPPDFWIDGVRAAFLNVDDVPLQDVEALEVYRGPSGLPPEYLTRVGSPGCGVVVIWTRLPGALE